ncbi:putative mediator of RNA polymerase II transcription subunit 26b [Dorcoceras hygrometricum]|uniref:Putative mediator of RNA polymerase II transcription subunit 26b n=1 Tax=Dorcoceras hygrometricum TaxID=472368 RepID=A0A2Z7A5E1_9LAMI|nr:putative mediator of RNA polymerase II transcription subunit 26b [Dorcoceras hygrometricum]
MEMRKNLKAGVCDREPRRRRRNPRAWCTRSVSIGPNWISTIADQIGREMQAIKEMSKLEHAHMLNDIKPAEALIDKGHKVQLFQKTFQRLQPCVQRIVFAKRLYISRAGHNKSRGEFPRTGVKAV